MTGPEAEKLTRVEERVTNVREDIVDIKADIKKILKQFDNQEKKFVTRLEFKAAGIVVSVVIAVLSFWFTHFERVNR